MNKAHTPMRSARQGSGEAAGDRQNVAIAAVLFGSLIFALGDAIVRLVSADLGLWQILVLRAIIVIPALVWMCRVRSRPIRLSPERAGWVSLRSALMVLMWVTYYGALLTLPVSVAASVYYTMPIFVALIAAMFIGDRIGVLGWFGVALGFVGVLLIVDPHSGGFNGYVLLPLASSLLFAVAMIVTRVKLRDEHPLAMTINLQLGFLVIGLLASEAIYAAGGVETTTLESFFASGWKSLGRREVIVILALAAIITIGNICTAIAFQAGRSATVATFSFSYIPFVTMWGFLFFGEVPDLRIIIGIMMIVVAGILSLRTSKKEELSR
ncbi:MAG: permease [SAR116 cluster bacterium]|nr:permease [SAR116 cluster bacterium]RPG98676.1 MAG: DMT family transporter [Candidatus Puniceispirillum sp. TMED176]